jgi:hypothetical protein
MKIIFYLTKLGILNWFISRSGVILGLWKMMYGSWSSEVCDGAYWKLVVDMYMYRCLIEKNCIKTLFVLLQFLVCGPELFLAFRAESYLQNPKLVSPIFMYLNHILHSPVLAYLRTHVRCSNGNSKGERHPWLAEFQILQFHGWPPDGW